MADRQIFYDPTGRRGRRFTLAAALFVLLNLLVVAALFATIRVVPAQPPLPVALEHGLPERAPKTLLARTRLEFDLAMRRLLGTQPPSAAKVGARQATAVATAMSKPLYVGFYVPWDESSTASLQRHIGALDWLAPVWLTVTGPNHQFNVIPDRNGRAVINSAAHRPLILPVVQNFANGKVDQAGIQAMLADPRLRSHFLDQLEPFLAGNSASGAVFDFEQLDRSGQDHYLELLREARKRFAKHRWLVTVAVPVGDEGWELRRFAAIADKLFLMAYDEHSNDGPAGPIASQQWWASSVAAAIRNVPRDKVIVTIGNYAYDWHDGTGDPENVEEAWVDAGDSDAKPVFDRVAANSTFAYQDEEGHAHTVWMLDAASAFNQLTILKRAGLLEVGLWRIGGEDPSLWSIFGRDVHGLPSPEGLGHLRQGTNVDIEGPGEILRITALPTTGLRKVFLGPSGLITNVDFQRVPRPFTITRTGYQPGEVALTFDDGPDPRWTPRILDILKEKKVPATFFIVGENALTERGLLRRMLSEGHEIGSHTYTHPNLANSDTNRTRFELNATQRLFEAFTGRTLKLFRAPFFGDAEPTTADEIMPVWEAQTRGYLSVGLHVDSEDWQRPGVPAIINNVVSSVMKNDQCDFTFEEQCSHNVVLLHDSGGDRTQTIEALPTIIDTLRARGYRFVPVSALAGLSPQQAMPPLSPSDHLAARVDLAAFELVGFGIRVLDFLFAAAITLGIARALFLAGLGLLSAWKDRRRRRPPIDPDVFVSVLIPAYNEERVIERSVAQVLQSRNVRVEVIVIDDGSHDRTSEIVKNAFGSDPRVRLLTLENGGKARALNRGLELTTSEIVIALDADTQFEADTIARLARWFAADERLGAVAGNAKVGNRINIVTKWQALEYITAQNLERRALGRLGAITVVPGAVGAWRKQAIIEVGGYPPETLAEDQDLTIAVQRAGWHVSYDQSAIAWTEAPQSLRQLARQRFRWAFGTIQCIWKHKRVMADGWPRGLAFLGLPQAIIFQLMFALVSPIIDLALIINIFSTVTSIQEHGYTAMKGDLHRVALFWILFAAIDITAGLIAIALEKRENWRLMAWLIPQRIVYRQIMYYVVIKALVQALRGPRVGWSSIARSGRVHVTATGTR